MKKITTLFVALVAIASAAAQEPVDSTEYLRNELQQANEKLAKQDKELLEKNKKEKWNAIWSKNRYTILSYAPTAEVTADDRFDEKSKFTFAIAKGNTYFLHRKPIAGLIKIGLDLRWTDVQVTKYKDVEYATGDNWTDTDAGNNDDPLSKIGDFGRWDMLVGVFGIGPTISIAPFSMFDNAAKYLRISVYGQYQPTLGLRLVKQDGETDTSFAYCNMFNAGGKIQYRRIALGVEKHWGSGKYSPLNLFGGDDEDSPKIKRKFSAFRLYVAFSF